LPRRQRCGPPRDGTVEKPVARTTIVVTPRRVSLQEARRRPCALGQPRPSDASRLVEDQQHARARFGRRTVARGKAPRRCHLTPPTAAAPPRHLACSEASTNPARGARSRVAAPARRAASTTGRGGRRGDGGRRTRRCRCADTLEPRVVLEEPRAIRRCQLAESGPSRRSIPVDGYRTVVGIVEPAQQLDQASSSPASVRADESRATRPATISRWRSSRRPAPSSPDIRQNVTPSKADGSRAEDRPAGALSREGARPHGRPCPAASTIVETVERAARNSDRKPVPVGRTSRAPPAPTIACVRMTATGSVSVPCAPVAGDRADGPANSITPTASAEPTPASQPSRRVRQNLAHLIRASLAGTRSTIQSGEGRTPASSFATSGVKRSVRQVVRPAQGAASVPFRTSRHVVASARRGDAIGEQGRTRPSTRGEPHQR